MSKLQENIQTFEIFIIEDDPIFTNLYKKNLQKTFRQIGQNLKLCSFTNCIDAIASLPDGCHPPALFILDVLLTGPDGFAFLNEIASYSDLSRVPVIIISSLNFPEQSFESYNIIKILNKATMTPQDLSAAVISSLNLKNTSQEGNN